MSEHDGDELESLVDELKREHPWAWRRVKTSLWLQAFIGKRLPWLCRHNASTGPAGGEVGWCMFCGRECWS